MMGTVDFDSYFLGRVDPRRMVQWRNALWRRARGLGNARVVIVGDSRVAGYPGGFTGVTDVADSWPTQLGAAFTAAGAQANTDCLVSHNWSTPQTHDSRVANSNWGISSTLRSAGGPILVCSTVGGKLSFTPNRPFDRIAVVRHNLGDGAATLDIDGGASIRTISSVGGNSLATTTDNVAAGMHTINLTCTAATVGIAAIYTWLSTESVVQILNLGWSGAKITDWVQDPTTRGAIKFIQNFAPHLVIMDGWVNDISVQTDMTQYIADNQTFLNAMLASGKTSVVINTPYSAKITGVGGQPDANQTPYHEAMRNLAFTNNLQLCDIQRRWGTYFDISSEADPTIPAGWMADPLHAYGTGNYDIAQAVYKVIGRP